MTTCIIVLAVITCTGTAPKQTPAEAVKVLTASVQPYVAPPPRADVPQFYSIENTPTFTTEATPIRPLSDPWSVTTYASRSGYVQTYFNGRPFVEAPGGYGGYGHHHHGGRR